MLTDVWDGPVINILVDVLTIGAWFGVVLGTLTGVMIDTLTDVMVGVDAIDMLNDVVGILVWASAATTLKFADPVSCAVDVLGEVVVNALAGAIFRVVSGMGVSILAAVTNVLEFAMPVS